MKECKVKVGDIVRIVDHDELERQGYKKIALGYACETKMMWNNSMDKWIGTTAIVFDIDTSYGKRTLKLSRPREKSSFDSITDIWTVTDNFVEVIDHYQAPPIEELLAKNGTYVKNLFKYNLACRVDNTVYYLTQNGWQIEPYTSDWREYTLPRVLQKFPQLRLGDDYILLDDKGKILNRFTFNIDDIPTYDNVADIRILRHGQRYRMFNDDDYIMDRTGKIIQVKEYRKTYNNISNRMRYLDNRYVEKHYTIIKGSLTGDITIEDTTIPTDITTLAAEMDDDTTTVYVKNDRVFNSENKFSIVKECVKYVG
nr:MAG TPA: protein of unknown function DUF4830 [Caudoviricetes sp.]